MTSAEPEQMLRVSTRFELEVRADYVRTAPLFGPEGERAWAGGQWNPEFVYPRPARDEQGAVFTIQHGAMQAVWVNTLFDTDARHFQYVYFLAGLMVTVIDVRFTPRGADATGVNVVYTRTALTPEGSRRVEAFSEGDRTAGQEWQEAIDSCLKRDGAGREA
jgi:hypothetical protein